MRKYRMNAAAINAAFLGDVLNPHLHKPVLTEKVDFDYFPEEHIDTVAEAHERELAIKQLLLADPNLADLIAEHKTAASVSADYASRGNIDFYPRRY